jgi:SAM-dependent methyltransferase
VNMLQEGYRRLLHEQSDPSRQVGWIDPLQQHLAFEILAGLGDLGGSSGTSVLDIGCGLGGFLVFLRTQGFVGRYTGIDRLPEFIERARSRYPGSEDSSSEVSFFVADILDADLALEPHDYVVASGLFDYRTPDSAKRLPRTVRQLFALCRRGVAFSLLNVAPSDREDLYRASPVELLKLCETLTPWFIVRGDYDPYALTFYLYKRDHFVTKGLMQLAGRLFLDTELRAQVLANPSHWAGQYGLTLQQLNLLMPLLAKNSAA